MAVDHIQHILIHTDDVEGTARWFEDNLGLARGGNPDFKVPLVWLYVGEVPAIHIAPFPEEGETRRFQDNYLGGRRTDVRYGSGVIDHVAFHCHDLAGTIERGRPVPALRRRAERHAHRAELPGSGGRGLGHRAGHDGGRGGLGGVTPRRCAQFAMRQ